MFDAAVVFISPLCDQAFPPAEREALKQRGLSFASDRSEAERLLLKEGRFIAITVTPDEPDAASESFFQLCQEHLQAQPEFQVIACNDPGPRLQCLAHELGITNFWGLANLPQHLSSWLQSQSEAAEKAAPLALRLSQAAARRQWQSIREALTTVETEAASDFRIAHLLGQFHLANSNAARAEEAFQSAAKLNPLFVPACSGLARAKLNGGKADEALSLLEQLDLINDQNVDRKTLMASACADLGRWEEAEKHLKAAATIAPQHPRVTEMRARVLFNRGDVNAAIAEIRKCSNVSDYYISKLNEEAIKLSRAGQTDRALTLYEAAWGAAPAHLKYKLSYNIAIAYKRKGDGKLAMERAVRAKQEAPASAQEKMQTLIESLSKEGSAP